MAASMLPVNVRKTRPLLQIYPWIPALVAAGLYPGLLSLFPYAITWYSESESTLAQTIAATLSILVMVIALAIPCVAIKALANIHNDNFTNAHSIRLALHLVFAVSPLYVFSLLVIGILEVGKWHTTLWVLSFVFAGGMLASGSGKSRIFKKPVSNSSLLRSIHGVSALCLMIGFVLLHLSNHGAAIWSVELHGTIMEFLRAWYQSKWVEPGIFVLLATMFATGLPMVLRYSKSDMDLFRTLQTCSGFYLMIFLMAHSLAVLGARSQNIETDWFFATGTSGLIHGFFPLIPYYILAVFILILHVSLGLRIILLTHHFDMAKANRMFFILTGLGAIFTLFMAMALLGIHMADLFQVAEAVPGM